MKFFGAVVLACLLQGAVSQIIRAHACKNKIIPYEGFDYKTVEGKWFIAEEYAWSATEGLKCASVTYDFSTANVSLHLEGIRIASGAESTRDFPVTAISAGVFDIEINTFPVRTTVVGTDIDNYIVYYGCIPEGEYAAEFLWIVTKERIASQEIINKARYDAANAGVDQYDFAVPMDQTNCPA